MLKKASKKGLKLRIAIAAPSGAGKTYGALVLASGIAPWDKIVVIDSENRSSNYYADLGDYYVEEIEAPYSPERYIAAIAKCEQAGMEVIIIDSTTHEWSGEGGILSIKDQMTGNDFTKWAQLTKRHDAFIDKMRTSKAHIIATIRSKQDYEVSTDNGKTKVEKLGLAPVQREGLEYEFGVALSIDIKHNATSSKDRTRLFDGKPPFVITADTGRLLLEWAEYADVNAIAEQERAERAERDAERLAAQKQDPAYAETKAAIYAEIKSLLSDTTVNWSDDYRKWVTEQWTACNGDLMAYKALSEKVDTAWDELKTSSLPPDETTAKPPTTKKK